MIGLVENPQVFCMKQRSRGAATLGSEHGSPQAALVTAPGSAGIGVLDNVGSARQCGGRQKLLLCWRFSPFPKRVFDRKSGDVEKPQVVPNKKHDIANWDLSVHLLKERYSRADFESLTRLGEDLQTFRL
jgi:hypothetical protein